MADSFKISASLDIPKSASKINADIPVLEKKLNSIRILAELDTVRSINSVQSQLNTIVKKTKAPTIKVDIDTNHLKNAINNAKSQVSNKNQNTKTQIFDSKQLESEGRKYFAEVTNIIDQVKNYYARNGALSIDISSIEKSNGQIKSFTASVEESTGVIKKFNFERGKINTGGAKLNYGFVQTDSLKSVDKNAGANFKSTLNFLTRINEKIISIQSKATKQSNPLKEGTVYYDNYNKKLSETVTKIDEIIIANKTLSTEQKNEINKLITYLQLYAKEQQKLAYPPMISSISIEDSVKKAQASLTTLEQKWKNQGILTGEFKIQVANLRAELEKVGNTEGLNKYNTSLKLVQENAKQLLLTQRQNVQIEREITTAITKLNTLYNSATFSNNSANPVVEQTKQQITQLIAKYQTLMAEMQGNITPSGFENIRNKLIELSNQFIQVTSTAKNFESQLKNNNSADKLAQKVALLTARIEAFKKVNSKSVKQFGSQYDSMLSELRNPNIDEVAYNRINKQFQTMRQEIVATDKAGKSLFDLFKEKSKKFLGWMSMTFMYSLATRTIRSMISDVVELDYALVDLKKTFKGTTSELQDFYYESSNIAKQLGVTSKEVITSASSWSRLGYNTKHAATEMAKAASIMKMISPNMDIETANSGLISIVKAFNEIDVGNIMNEVISPINEVGNTFAVSNSDILEGLQRSSAAMKMMGEDLTSTIALFTAGKFCCLYVQKCA